MSALIPFAKAFHALASALQVQGEKMGEQGEDGLDKLLTNLSRVFSAAADDLGEQARAECSGTAGETYTPPEPEPRKRRT